MADNPLLQADNAGPGPTAVPSVSPAGDPMLGALQQAHGKSSSQFDKLATSRKMLDSVRSSLDALTKLGDTVEPEDVIKAAGDLTGAGLEPAALAQLLATMPQGGGVGLAAWVQQQDQMVTQREAAVDQQQKLAAHQLGVDSLHLLMHDHMHSTLARQAQGLVGGQGQGPQPANGSSPAPSPQQPNPLM